MMGGILAKNQATDFKILMNWDSYEEDNNNPEDIKLTLSDSGLKRNVMNEAGDTGEVNSSYMTELLHMTTVEWPFPLTAFRIAG